MEQEGVVVVAFSHEKLGYFSAALSYSRGARYLTNFDEWFSKA